jgi:hypothetical protein
LSVTVPATGRWFSPGPPVSSTNKTDRHDITKILLKVVLNTIKQTNKRYVALSDTHVIILYDVSVIRVFVLLKYMLGAELTR